MFPDFYGDALSAEELEARCVRRPIVVGLSWACRTSPPIAIDRVPAPTATVHGVVFAFFILVLDLFLSRAILLA
jgi:hypothetical protein